MTDQRRVLVHDEEPEFPDYDVVDSADLDAVQAARNAGLVTGAELVAQLDDDKTVELAARIKQSREQFCYRCPKLEKAGIVLAGTPAKFVLRTEKGDRLGLCKRHGKKLHDRFNAPKMAIPRGRH